MAKRSINEFLLNIRRNNMKTTLKLASLSKTFAMGLSITNLRAKASSVCLANSLFSRNISVTISMLQMAVRKKWLSLNQYSKVTQSA